MPAAIHDLLAGAAAMACVVIGLKFLAYWRVSRDRLFVFFAAAFWVFALGGVLRTVMPGEPEDAHLLYLPRLAGFLLIVIAILNKNREAPG